MAGEARLLRASLQGDHAAFARIVRRYQSLVCAITYSGTGDLPASEDLAQETFIAAWKKLDSLRDPSRLRGWLCAIARNLALQWRRQCQGDVISGAVSVDEAGHLESTCPTLVERSLSEERASVVWGALNEMPEEYRMPLVLYYREQQSVGRVAREMELSPSAVKKRLIRGRGMLRDKVAALVEDTLSTSAPGSTFAAAVLASIAGTAAKKGVGSTILGLSLAKATAIGVLIAGTAVGAAVALQADVPEPAPAVAPVATPAPEPVEEAADAQPRGALVRGVVVDEEGKPVPGVLVNALGKLAAAPEDAVTAADGSFTLRIDVAMQCWTKIRASAQGGRSQGLYRFGPGPIRVPPIRIVLRPARRVEVTVTDGQGEPVLGAVVETYDYYTVPLPGAETDEAGRAEMFVPADAKIRWIVAAKPGVGFDYFENYASWPPLRESGVPDSAHLVLDGATTVRVTAIDSGWKPIKGVEFVPSLIQKEGKLHWAGVGGTRMLVARGDADGVATFDWIPSTRTGRIYFGIHDRRFHCQDSPWYDRTDSTGEVTAVLLRNTRISGKVLLPDGSPSVDTLVQAESRGDTNYCRAYARTVEDGSYNIWADAEQTYIIAVLDEEWAAPSRMGVFVQEGRPVEEADFQLGPGTLIHGTARIGQDERPAAGRTVVLVQRDPLLPEEFLGDRGEHEAHLVRWTETDDAGRYWFRAARGVFTIGVLPDGDELSLVVEDQAEIVQDFLLEEPDGRN